MRNPVKKPRTKAAKTTAKSQSKKTAKIKWVKSDDAQAAASNTLAGCRYDIRETSDEYTRLTVHTQAGTQLLGYTCKDVSTAELLVTLIEEGRLLP